MMPKILWADDEIDILKPQILFLQEKGYEVITVSNGYDAIEECNQQNDLDIIFLDESMPGLSGLETLNRIKDDHPNIPIVMITKNEAETVMEEAIGSRISDYLIKPVNPNQILLTLKKLTENKRLVSEKVMTGYQQDFRSILMDINQANSVDEWVEIYKKIMNWELKMDSSRSQDMSDILNTQKTEANGEFSRFVDRNYHDWIAEPDDAPVMSWNLMRKKVFPRLSDDRPTIFILLDNLRYDQWKVLAPIISERFRITSEEHFFSILPTTTQYSRNAIFGGMMPSEIAKFYPDWWKNDAEEGGKNQFESDLLGKQLEKVYRKPLKWTYQKITNLHAARLLQDNATDYLQYDFSAIVYNFIDMLSHARTEMDVLKELAGDETAYRSLTQSWFLHSPLWAAMQRWAEKKPLRIVITTDHGTIRVKTPTKVIADRDTTTNLRYKVGKNLQYEAKDVLEIRDPDKVGLPRPNVSSAFIFAKDDRFFLYPNNYTYYHNYYKNTFQHGGISLEEMICPFIVLEAK
ncbi:MAG: PglZ domain-containing protein [Lewinellaceae bacterium]|nr:PglZ domain-containing protein [Lewinellaceae bacterium]